MVEEGVGVVEGQIRGGGEKPLCSVLEWSMVFICRRFICRMLSNQNEVRTSTPGTESES